MAEERVQRRLAAILAADVVGYTRLMEADEEGTLARMKKLRADVIDPKIAEYGGRIFKTTGDGFLAEFPSVVDAVRHAVDVQRAMMRLNADVPEDSRFAFRIGVSLGDVMVDGDDLFGNGVNVASRMEGLAEVGGICVSGNVQEHIGNSAAVVLEDLGEQSVRNIDRPVRCYRIHLESGDGADLLAQRPEELPSLIEKPSIAVLPFENISGDPEQEYFVDGITEDIITALSRIRQFFVIARNTTFTYKGQAVDVQAVAKDLGVRYVLEGSVRKAGNRIRITAQLVDGNTANHIWAERYDRDLEDIFAVQDELTLTLVAAIEPALDNAERQRALLNKPNKLGAWDLYQRGRWHLNRRTAEDAVEAQNSFEQAMAMDATFGAAFAGYAWLYQQNRLFGYTPLDAETAAKAAQRAVLIDANDPYAHFALGQVNLIERDHDAAIAEFKVALQLNPSFADAYRQLAWSMVHAGDAEESIPHIEAAMRLSPQDVNMGLCQSVYTLAQLYLRKHEEAVNWARKAIRQPSVPWPPWAFLAAALGHLENVEEAQTVLADLRRVNPDVSLTFIRDHIPTTDPDSMNHLLEGLRKAGLP